MWHLRYLMVYVSEFILTKRSEIASMGYEKGSWGALFSWCHGNATYCADGKHPLYYCVCRNAWVDWMQENS